MPVVTLQGVHKAYGPHVVLGSVDLTVSRAERIGVVGVNGAGKTTLCRVLSGIEPPDAGEVQMRRGAEILYLHQIPEFAGNPSAEEAVLAGLGAWTQATARHEALSAQIGAAGADSSALLDELSRAAEEVERLGGWEQRHRPLAMLQHLGIRRPEARVQTLSGGEQRRVALARLLVAKPDLAVLDEPTNHLDADTVEWLEKYLIEEYTGAIVLITHDRYLLDRVASRTLELSNGEVFDYEGGYERYLEQKAERLAHAARVERNRQNFLRRELEWLRRQPKARSTKQQARVDRARSALEQQRPAAEKTAALGIELARTGKTILEVENLSIEIGEQTLFENLNLSLTEGERIGVVGPNGSGKTTLLRALVGELEPASGRVVTGKNTRIAYLDQHRSGLEAAQTVYDNVMGDQSTVVIGGHTLEPRAYLERFAFDNAKQRQPVGSLSGGERARVALARMLRQSANLVILDEPTNDLDVQTLAALESILVDYGVTALVVTHDRWFLDRVATGILAFEAPGKVLRYPGNYATYRRLVDEAARKSSQAPGRVQSERRASRAKPAPKKGLTFAERRELEGLLDAVERAESRVAELTERLGNPATYANGGKDVAKLHAELELEKAEVTRLTLRWEELENKQSAN